MYGGGALNSGALSFGILPGEIYRHYKGKIVSVLGVAIAAPPNQYCLFQTFAIARWTDDTAGDVRICQDPDGVLRFPHGLSVEPLVLYSCSGGLWVRSVSDFLGHVPRGSTPFLETRRFFRLPGNENILNVVFEMQRRPCIHCAELRNHPCGV